MILSKIWERYLFKETLKVFFLFLGLFYFLYASIHYSTHMQDFLRSVNVPIIDIGIYYAYHFSKVAHLLLPLALLIATIKVLTTLNANRELVALQACGMKLISLLRPFFLMAILCSVLSVLNFEFLTPRSAVYLRDFKVSHLKHEHREKRAESVHVLHLKDQTKLVYQSYDAQKNLYLDAIWLRSIDDIWKMKGLSNTPSGPIGYYVDHLKRTPEGLLEKVESFPTYTFKEIQWIPERQHKEGLSIESKRFSQLARLAWQKYDSFVATHLYYKTVISLLSFLVVIASAPFCLRYTRNLQIFFIYAIALFGYLAFFTMMDAAVILGENQVFGPLFALFTPFALCLSFFTWKFTRKVCGI